MDKICGVYKITNTVDGKVYVGSSYNIKVRKARHLWELKNGRHSNQHLQSAWEKYGEEAFAFEILIECEKEDLLAEEQKELNKIWGSDGRAIYNVAKNTLAPMAGIQSPMKGRNHSRETRERMSKTHTGMASPNKGNKYPKELKEKMSRDRKGIGAGEKNAMSVLNWEKVNKMRELFKTGNYTHAQLAKNFDISRTNVTNIVNNKRWTV